MPDAKWWERVRQAREGRPPDIQREALIGEVMRLEDAERAAQAEVQKLQRMIGELRVELDRALAEIDRLRGSGRA